MGWSLRLTLHECQGKGANVRQFDNSTVRRDDGTVVREFGSSVVRRSRGTGGKRRPREASRLPPVRLASRFSALGSRIAARGS